VRFSVRQRGIVIAMALAFLVYGLTVLTRTTYDVFPEFAPPQVAVTTDAPGLTPEQVELLVTQPLENILNGLPGIQSLRSSTSQGFSMINVTFAPGSDIFRDRQQVAEPLAAAASLMPAGVKPPEISPLTSSTSTVIVAGLTSKTKSLMDLRTIAETTIAPRLLAVSGVAKVTVFGGEEKEVQVQVHPDRLLKYGLSIAEVSDAAGRAVGVRGAGFIQNRNQYLVLSPESAAGIDDITRAVVVHAPGGNVTIGDVASVLAAPEPPVGAALIDGEPGVGVVVSAQYGQNTLEVTERSAQALADFSAPLAKDGVTLNTDLFRPATFINQSVHNLLVSLLLGAALVVVVLFLFLANLRTAAISCLSIPLSLLLAAAALERLGLSLNTMTLGGLAIAIGEVVDDAVIGVENILRRLRENQRLDLPRPKARVVLAAAVEVRSAVVYATAAVALVFVPILTMSGLAGSLFAPLGIAYILSVVASLLVAVTVTPALCLLLINPHALAKTEPPVVRGLKSRYVRLLGRVESHSGTVIAAVAIFSLAGAATLPFIGGSFLPELREGNYIVHMSASPGTSLDESMRLGRLVSQALLKMPAIHAVTQFTGRAEKGDDINGPHYSESYVTLDPVKGSDEEQVFADVRGLLGKFLGVNFAINSFLSERVEETVSGFGAEVVVNIYGNNLDELDEKAGEVTRVLQSLPAAEDVTLQSPPGSPRMVVRLKEDGLSRYGLAAMDVLEAVRAAYQGEQAAEVYEGNRVVEVVVILAPASRQSPTDAGRLLLKSPDGRYVSLSEVADIYETSGRFVILHDGARRVQTITCDAAGQDVNAFIADARRAIDSAVSFPPGMYFTFGGTAQAEARSRRDLLLHSLLTGIGIVLLLSIVAGNARNLALLLANLPFALVGGVLMVFAMGGGLSLGALVGFVTLFGITLRNSIMMISHFEHLVGQEGQTWGVDTAVRGASERLAPILMTALVTGLGLLPLALGGEAAGREIEGPLALVILGGLFTSTVLNLLVLPALSLRYGQFGKSEDDLREE